jgi:hypothetical protein
MYYEPHASRSNLVVLTSAHVAKISLSKSGSGDATAESVTFLHGGNEYRALVRKEVIVSAGYASHLLPSTIESLTCFWLLQDNGFATGSYSMSPAEHRPSYKTRS